jgi:DNA repair exonuclease SbcCD nuclease subunit
MQLQTLGDVHLERRFRTGVPLHRIGHREVMVWEQFYDEVMNPTGLLHVQMGDLFNEFSVSEATVLRAAAIYQEASIKNHGVRYVVIRGNHDAARDADKKSSFDVFKGLMKGYDNVEVMVEPTIRLIRGKAYGFMPWHPFKSSTELATELLDIIRTTHSTKFEAVFCHCDVKSYGGTDDNLIPLNVLKHRTNLVYTGHIHYPHEFEQDGVKVVVVGSMQPYAHGEDPVGDWYKTIGYDTLMHMTCTKVLKDVNVRVLISKNDDVFPEFDCLSCTTKKWEEAVDEEESEQVELESFDMTALFKQSLAEHSVGTMVSEKILSKFSEKKHG